MCYQFDYVYQLLHVKHLVIVQLYLEKCCMWLICHSQIVSQSCVCACVCSCHMC